jgi:hypothetical protein
MHGAASLPQACLRIAASRRISVLARLRHQFAYPAIGSFTARGANLTTAGRAWFPRSLLVLAASVAVLLLPGTTRAATSLPKLLNFYGGPFVVRPPFIGITPTDGQSIMGLGRSFRHPGSIKWESWTDSAAQGRGALWVDTCARSCAAGPQDRYPALIRASDVHNGRFGLLTIRSSYRESPLVYKMIIRPGAGSEFVYVSG